jgi:hypothetical protein
MTLEERDALIARGVAFTWIKYNASWSFEAIDPHREIDGFFRCGLTSPEELHRLHGDLDSWPYNVRMAVRWLHAIETGSGPPCRCILCRRRIEARLELGQVVFAYPDDPHFPQESRATALVCARCAARSGYRTRLWTATESFTRLVGVTVVHPAAK